MGTYRLCVDFPDAQSLLSFVEYCNAFQLTASPAGAMEMDSLHEKVGDESPHKFILRNLREDGTFLATREVCTTEAVLERHTLVRVEWDTDGEDEEIFGIELPELILVPAHIENGRISDWLSDKHGWLVRSWKEESR